MKAFAHLAVVMLLAVGVTPKLMAQKPPAKAAEKKPAEVAKEYEPQVKQLKDKDAKLRAKAAEELGTKGETAASTATALCDAIMDKSPKVAQAALVALETVRPDLYKPISKMVLDSSPINQFQAIADLGVMEEKALPAKNLLLARMRVEAVAKRERVADIGGPGISVLARTPPLDVVLDSLAQIDFNEPEVVKTLKALAGPANTEAVRRLNSIDRLMLWATDDEKRQKEILPLIGAGIQNNNMVIPCVEKLATYGGLSKDYLPALKKLKLSNSAAVRDAASKAVEVIEGKYPFASRPCDAGGCGLHSTPTLREVCDGRTVGRPADPCRRGC